jgi:hypothetical protein
MFYLTASILMLAISSVVRYYAPETLIPYPLPEKCLSDIWYDNCDYFLENDLFGDHEAMANCKDVSFLPDPYWPDEFVDQHPTWHFERACMGPILHERQIKRPFLTIPKRYQVTLVTVGLAYLQFASFLTVLFTGWLEIYINRRYYLALLIHWFATRKFDAPFLRSEFRDVNVRQNKSPKGHGHPISAANRTYAADLADAFFRRTNIPVEFVQGSRHDQRLERPLSRTYYWDKDLGVSPAEPTDKAKIIIDSDFYLRPHELVSPGKPSVIYTYNPTTVATICDDYSYTFVNNEIKFTVGGGMTYQHPLWNYNYDCIRINHGWQHWYSSTIYQIEHRAIGGQRTLVLLAPVCQFKWYALPVLMFLEAQPLAYLKTNSGDYSRLDVQTATNRMTSIAKQGEYYAATVPSSVISIGKHIQSLSKTGLSASQIASIDIGSRMSQNDAYVITDYLIHGAAETSLVSMPPVMSYSMHKTDRTKVVKPSVKAFMKPLDPNCWAPELTPENELSSVTTRITKLQERETPHLSRKMASYATDFAEYVFPKPLTKYNEMDVMDRQSTPSQRNILFRGVFEKFTRHISTFLKREAYVAPKDPRTITTYPGIIKSEYGKFLYPIMDHVKQFSWYAFGRTPKEIATRVAEICNKARRIIPSDYHRMDGTNTEATREIEAIAMAHAFPGCQEARDLQNQQFNNTGHTQSGIRYEQLFARGSGSLETSVFTTYLNAFIAYATFRNMGYSHAEAIAQLGIYGGDDGLTGDIDTDLYVKTAESVGLIIEIEILARENKQTVPFLARIYSPNVWFGALDSMSDLKRAVSKLHVTHDMQANPLVKAQEKAAAILLTDPNTPILSKWAKSVPKGIVTPEGWWGRFDLTVQYPNENDGWMDDIVLTHYPRYFDLVVDVEYPWDEWPPLAEFVNNFTVESVEPCAQPEPPPPIPIVNKRGDRGRGWKNKTEQDEVPLLDKRKKRPPKQDSPKVDQTPVGAAKPRLPKHRSPALSDAPRDQ